MRTRKLLGLALGLALHLALHGCERRAAPPEPPVGAAASPSDPPPGDAPRPILRPLTVHVFDWSAVDRSELERSLAGGRAIVVAERGDAVRLVPGCDADTTGYDYAGHEPRRDHVAGAAFTYDATLIGAWTARVVPTAVQGSCTGATHVARVVEVGAFEQATSSVTHNAGDVALPGGGVVGGSFSSTTSTRSAGGEPAACVRGDRPPPGCAAVVRMVVDPLPPP